MEIRIDEEDLKEYVESAVKSEINRLTDEIIFEKVRDLLIDRVDGIFSNRDDIKRCVDKHVEKIVRENVSIDKEAIEKVGKNIANDIAYNLRESILESIACRLAPYEEEEEMD